MITVHILVPAVVLIDFFPAMTLKQRYIRPPSNSRERKLRRESISINDPVAKGVKSNVKGTLSSIIF